MKTINLFTSNLTGKALKIEQSESKKAVKTSLADFSKSINAEFTKVIKSEDKRARNVSNAAKGQFKTAVAVVAGCYPYQTKDGVLCCKRKDETGVKVWAEKKLTAAAARGIVRDSLNNFIKGVGKPEITIVEIGDAVI